MKHKIKILREVVEFILNAGRETYPKEFVGLLRAEKNTITEVLILPGTLFGENSATIRLEMMPLDPTAIGSVHTHPSRSYTPSEEDLRFFQKFGKIHLIARYPFKSIAHIAAYNQHGQRVTLKEVD